jgi:hypothetical protein
MLQRAGILVVAGLLGAGSAAGVAGCGDERGSVKFEGDTGGTATGGTATVGTATAETETVGTTEPTTTEP